MPSAQVPCTRCTTRDLSAPRLCSAVTAHNGGSVVIGLDRRSYPPLSQKRHRPLHDCQTAAPFSSLQSRCGCTAERRTSNRSSSNSGRHAVDRNPVTPRLTVLTSQDFASHAVDDFLLQRAIFS